MKKASSASYSFIAPAFVLLGTVTIYPLIAVCWLSFRRELLIFDISEFVGLRNFQILFADDRFWSALKNTLYFAAVSVGCELLLGLIVALFLNSLKGVRAVVVSCLLLPWVLPTVVSAKMWEWNFNSEFGFINFLLSERINWLGDPNLALHAAIFIDVWKTTPMAAILLLAALKSIPTELFKAARVDGANSLQLFSRVILPLIMPTLFVVAILRVIDALRVFDVVYVLTGGGPAGSTETLSVYAYKLLFQTLQFGYGSSVALSVFVLALIFTITATSIRARYSK